MYKHYTKQKNEKHVYHSLKYTMLDKTLLAWFSKQNDLNVVFLIQTLTFNYLKRKIS